MGSAAVLKSGLLLAAAGLGACAHQASVASASFKFERQQVVVPATLGRSSPMSFLLDCGVDPSVIDIEIAEKNGLLTAPGVVGEAEGGGEGEGQAVAPAMIRELTIGSETFPPFEAVASDLSPFANAIGGSLDGILGYSFFKDRVIRIDYPNRRVDIAASRASLPPAPKPPSNEYSVPLVFMSADNMIPVVEVMIAGLTLRMSVDTGSSLGVQLYETATTTLGIDPDDGEPSSLTGARGKAAIVNTTLAEVAIGPFVLADVPASLSKRAHDPAERVGNLGNRFLQNFVVTFDYAEGVLTFARE